MFWMLYNDDENKNNDGKTAAAAVVFMDDSCDVNWSSLCARTTPITFAVAL